MKKRKKKLSNKAKERVIGALTILGGIFMVAMFVCLSLKPSDSNFDNAFYRWSVIFAILWPITTFVALTLFAYWGGISKHGTNLAELLKSSKGSFEMHFLEPFK